MKNNFKKNQILKIAALAFCLPQTIFAAGLTDIIDAAFGIINTILIPIAFALCVFYFFWGVAKYIRSGAGGENAAKEGKNVMVWGIVGLFIAFSVWGIIKFIQTELDLPDIQNIDRPPINATNSSINYN